uniref:Uncharacterized protein n=1 Tax=Panagrolaimus sp. JU765 TaxID=591449 RepID=A0AC34R4W5_9BILA
MLFFEPQLSPKIFRRVRQKKREKSGEKSGRKSLSPNPNPLLLTSPKHVPNQDGVIRPQNFKEILNRFQTAVSDTSTTVSPLNFQRHHSVRIPTINQKNRRFTLGGETLMISTKNNSSSLNGTNTMNNKNNFVTSSLQPPPIIKLRTSTTNNLVMTNPIAHSDHESDDHEQSHQQPHQQPPQQSQQQPMIPKREKHYIQRRESDAYQAAIKAKKTNLVGNFNGKKFNDDGSSHDEDKNEKIEIIQPPPPVKKRQSKIDHSTNNGQGQYQATNAVAVRKPKPANRTNSNMSGAQRKLSNHSMHSNHSNSSSLRNLKEIDENSNDRHFDEPSHHQSTFGSRPATAEYVSGGSDSGYARYPNSTETSSMESPRSPSQLLRSPNPVRTKVADELYGQMTVQHTNTLAFVVDNYSDIVSNFNELSEYGRDLFEDLSIENLIFKSTTPILVKEKLAVFDAAYVTPNYTEHRVTVMLAPTCQYAPLMGRLAERSGFGPTILAEIEEPEITFRNLLEQAGIDFIQRSSIYKVMIMPPISLCSFHSLAVHNMHKAMNVQRYEHHVCFIMLQLLCALKVLQSDGVEHLSNNFKEFLLTYKAVDLKNALEDLQQLPKLMFLRVSLFVRP